MLIECLAEESNAWRRNGVDVTDPMAARAARARVLAALGDPVRLGLVDLLGVQDLSPAALSAELGIPGNLLAHHLKVLERAGLIARTTSRNDRRRTYVRLVPTALVGLLPAPAPVAASRVVFVCTHNSARSVMAEAAWRAVSDVPTASAGTDPGSRFHPRATAALRRAGWRVGHGRPRRIDEVLEPEDLVVSVCDAVNEDVAALPNRRLHWSIPDPSAIDTDEAFTDALAEVRQRTAQLADVVAAGR
ncbi:MAG: ArsR family transcriptional regulator, arsenate/arsenite/antimonite-responsive transcriptional [Actinomycetota bacterium]|nr:ArsR family transcriptional regulator, arsenate/arsenite/antimonite-responsive transcriptional [Actinomycetota bacterium]